MGGELGELSRVFQHVIQQRQASHRDAQLLLTKMRAIMAKAPVGIALTRHRRFELVQSTACSITRKPASRARRRA